VQILFSNQNPKRLSKIIPNERIAGLASDRLGEGSEIPQPSNGRIRSGTVSLHQGRDEASDGLGLKRTQRHVQKLLEEA
jgi:hypothetical protein